jgi:tetratricopeptide (TPR) repeat protein
MNDNDTNTTLLIQYLDGELEGNKLAEVENKISSDPSLQQELENLRDAELVIKSYGLWQQVGNIHKEMMEELKLSETKRAFVRQMFSKASRVAATFIVVVGFIAVYQYASLSSGKLFDSNYEAYVVHEVRGEASSSDLEHLYKQNLTKQVISEFYAIKHPSIKDYFYLGNAYLKENKAPLAIHSFELLQQKNAQMNTHLLEDDAEYYLAMAYLQNNEAAKALPIFEKIHNDQQHLYHDKVGSLFLFKIKLLAKK